MPLHFPAAVWGATPQEIRDALNSLCMVHPNAAPDTISYRLPWMKARSHLGKVWDVLRDHNVSSLILVRKVLLEVHLVVTYMIVLYSI